MAQILLIETNQTAYLNMLDQYLKQGYHLIAGSNYIKSIPTGINVTTGQVLQDIEHVYSIGIYGKFDSVVFSKKLTNFRESVNEQLKSNSVITGSLYIEAEFKDAYERCKRSFVTYYCCCLYKE